MPFFFSTIFFYSLLETGRLHVLFFRTVLEFTNSINPVLPIVVFHCDEAIMAQNMVSSKHVENCQETIVENFCKKSEETPLADLSRNIKRKASRSESGKRSMQTPIKSPTFNGVHSLKNRVFFRISHRSLEHLQDPTHAWRSHHAYSL